MPTYEYGCDRCGHRFERFQSMLDEPVKRCPKCRCKVRRLFHTGAGIIFKGSGFYETDYKQRKPDAAKGEKAGASESASGGSTEAASKSSGDGSKQDAGKPAAKPKDT